MSFELFERALKGIDYYSPKKINKIVIIDYEKPSSEERFYLIDLKNREILYKTYVSHGEKSGLVYATDFSNEVDSHKSSLGFYKTAETYYGSYGYSLKLDGLEPGINSNARKRYIVIHGYKFVSEEFIKEKGRLGLSWGCPSLSMDLYEEIINEIKGGVLLYINGASKEYLEKSKVS